MHGAGGKACTAVIESEPMKELLVGVPRHVIIALEIEVHGEAKHLLAADPGRNDMPGLLWKYARGQVYTMIPPSDDQYDRAAIDECVYALGIGGADGPGGIVAEMAAALEREELTAGITEYVDAEAGRPTRAGSVTESLLDSTMRGIVAQARVGRKFSRLKRFHNMLTADKKVRCEVRQLVRQLIVDRHEREEDEEYW